MKSRLRMIAALVYLVASVGLVFGQTNKAEGAVRAADAAWLKAYDTKDVQKAVAVLDEQGSMLMSNAPIATGKKAVAKLIAADFARSQNLTWHVDKAGVAASGDLGYTSGSYEMSFQDASGKTVADKGKYLTVWKKQADGSWKVLFDMFNTDLPAA